MLRLSIMRCPVCTASDWKVFASASEIEKEGRVRERFVKERLARPAAPEELKDLTDFFHGAAAELLACTECGLLYRHELERPDVQEYAEDKNAPEVMERQFPRYVAAFARKEQTYRPLLTGAPRVLEIGSHYGAFLQVATQWGWRVEGVDVGRDTAHFAQCKGFTVHMCELKDCGFDAGTFDAVFVWNCFEQIEEPAPLLTEIRRILKEGGLLVLRVPNARFYEGATNLLNGGTLSAPEAGFLVEALGYNNLLGFPYLYGHRPKTLKQLATRFGFRPEGEAATELLTLPLPEEPRWVCEEERAINDRVKALGGAWVEVWFRATIP